MSDMQGSTRKHGDLPVSPVGVGLARWSIGADIDDDAAERFLRAALDAGVDHVDTALAYTTSTHPSHSESLIGRVLATRPTHGRPFVATKGGHFRAGDAWLVDGRPETLRAHCAASLAALGVDSLDLYYLHKVDPAVPLLDSLGALEDLRRAGDIRRVGVSNVSPAQLAEAVREVRLDAVQNPFSPDSPDHATLALCDELGISYVAYSPLGGSRRTHPLGELSSTARSVAGDAGVAIETVWLAWLLAQSSRLVLITGARRDASLRASLAAATLELPLDTVARMSEEAAA